LASDSIAEAVDHSPARAVRTWPQYWVWPSYIHIRLLRIGRSKPGVQESSPRRNLPFHECVNSWAITSRVVKVRSHAVK
jgi:hypothetical protein